MIFNKYLKKLTFFFNFLNNSCFSCFLCINYFKNSSKTPQFLFKAQHFFVSVIHENIISERFAKVCI